MKEYSLKERELSRAAFVMMTPGQGSQFNGMAADLVQHPVGAAVFREVDEILEFGLTELMCDPAGEALKDNAVAQPAIVATTIAAREVYLAEHPDMTDIIPSFYIGHSLGELTALYFAGVLTAHDVLVIARERGKLMQQVNEQTPGGIVTVITKKEKDMITVDEICNETGVCLATYNTPIQVSISGLADNIQEAIILVKKAGFGFFPLNNVPPSHTQLMQPAMVGLRDFIDRSRIVFRNANAPVITNLTGKSADRGTALQAASIEQVVNPVRFEQGISYARAHGLVNFVEFGPRTILAKFIPQIFPINKHGEEYFSALSIHDVKSAKEAVLTPWLKMAIWN